jgi:hypothetical protein
MQSNQPTNHQPFRGQGVVIGWKNEDKKLNKFKW